MAEERKSRQVKIIEPCLQDVTELKTKLKVAAYARVSTASLEQAESYDNQVKFYEEKIQSNPAWSLVEVYADQAISGTTSRRPAFQRMIADAQAGKIELILTKSISRFSRNIADLTHYVRLLKELNVAVHFEEDHINTEDDRANLILSLLGSIAQMEVENTSSHVKWTMAEKMKRGEVLGFTPLGYDSQLVDGVRQLVINEQEADVVRYIFNQYASGVGMYTLCHRLQAHGYKTKRGSSRWTSSALSVILHNEKYCGDLVQGKTYSRDPISHRRYRNRGQATRYELSEAHEPIIDRQLFDRVQTLMERQRFIDNDRHQPSQRFVFSGRMRCAYCGATLLRRKIHVGTKYERATWLCGNAVHGGKKACAQSKAVNEDYVKQMFLITLNDLLTDEDYFLYLSKEEFERWLKAYEPSFDDRRKQIERQTSVLHNQKSTLLDLLLESRLTTEEFSRKSAEIDQKLQTLQDELDKIMEEHDRRYELASVYEMIRSHDVSIFNDDVFDKLVESVTVGGLTYNEHGQAVDEPRSLRFTLKSETLSRR